MDYIGINDFSIDHFNEDGVLDYEDDLLDFGDIADLSEEVIET